MMKFHAPRLYRYKVADPGIRFKLNKYPGAIIGAAFVAGDYAYCIKWGRPC